jgi:hypothetical protein
MPGNWEPWPGNTYAFIGLMFGGQIYGKFILTAEAQRQQRDFFFAHSATLRLYILNSKGAVNKRRFFLCILCASAVRKKKYFHTSEPLHE